MGGFRGSEIEKWVKSAKRLDRLAPNLAHICGFVWERTWAKKIITPLETPGGILRGLCGKKLKPGKCGQTAGLIGTNFGALMQIHLERVVGPKKLAGGGGLGLGGGGGGGVRNSKVRKSTCEHTHAYSSTKGSRPIGGGGVSGGGVGGQKVRKSTCEHTYTHAYSSTKGSRPNKN